MPLPELTSLQFLVLDILGAQQRPGRFIRERMAENGVRKSLASFYQLMSRLEDAKLLTGENFPIVVGNQPAMERRYKITGNGIRAHRDVLDFYARKQSSAANNGGLSHA